MSDSMRETRPESRCVNIADRCPACGRQSLFVGEGGWLTCSVIGCKEPGVSAAIEAERNAAKVLKAEIGSDLAEALVSFHLDKFNTAKAAIVSALKRLEATR